MLVSHIISTTYNFNCRVARGALAARRVPIRGTTAGYTLHPNGMRVRQLFDFEIRGSPLAVSRMATAAGSLNRLQIGGLISRSGRDRFGGIAPGLGELNRVIRVPRLPERDHLLESIGELGSLGGRCRGVRSAANGAQGRLH